MCGVCFACLHVCAIHVRQRESKTSGLVDVELKKQKGAGGQANRREDTQERRNLYTLKKTFSTCKGARRDGGMGEVREGNKKGSN